MTKEQLHEVEEAVNEMYTLREIYWKVSNNDWTEQMFELFVNRVMQKSRKQ